MAGTFDRRAVADREQIRLLSSPVRQEMVDTLAALGGAASVAALADQLGRPADGLYFHLEKLVRGGLVEKAATAEGEEQLYRLAGEGDAPLRLAYRTGPDGNAAELSAFGRGLLQIAGRDFDEALAMEGVATAGPRRELWASRNKGWLSAGDVEEVNALLERLSALTSQPRAAGRDRLMSCAFVLAPVSPRPRRRGRRGVARANRAEPLTPTGVGVDEQG
jgi:DNA-binding transcriptional ArsR family regulator